MSETETVLFYNIEYRIDLLELPAQLRKYFKTKDIHTWLNKVLSNCWAFFDPPKNSLLSSI